MSEIADHDEECEALSSELEYFQIALASALAKLNLAKAICAEAVPILKALTENGCECDSDGCRCGIGNVRNLIGRMEAIARQ